MKLFQLQQDHVGLLILIVQLKELDQHSPADKDYEGGFATALMYKDLGLAVDAAMRLNQILIMEFKLMKNTNKLPKIIKVI